MATSVTDDQLFNLIENGIMNSSGDWLNATDLARERLKATYEYAGLANYHLAPQGVSTIVDTSTTEVIEAYTAVISDLFLANNKLARFVPYDESPGSYSAAKDASALVNYCLFKKNNGWEFMQQWIKSALLWKNAVCRWYYVDDTQYVFEEFESISQSKLDELLANDNVEIVGDLEFENTFSDADPLSSEKPDAELMYVNVRIRKKIDRSKVKIDLIPPESFRISRDAVSIEDASFVGIQSDMTRSEIRMHYPDIDDLDFDDIGEGYSGMNAAAYSEDVAARKLITGQEYHDEALTHEQNPLEANRSLTVTECWVNVDRDGDGIAELKHIITVGDYILHEEDIDSIPLASIVPIDIPHEFFGLSMADFT